MKIIQLLQIFALTFSTIFLCAGETKEKDMRVHVEPNDLFMGDGRIIVYKDGDAIELSEIRIDENGYSYFPEDIKCELQTLEKGGRSEDRRWYHCRRCDATFRTEYELHRHMIYDHYHTGTRR